MYLKFTDTFGAEQPYLWDMIVECIKEEYNKTVKKHVKENDIINIKIKILKNKYFLNEKFESHKDFISFKERLIKRIENKEENNPLIYQELFKSMNEQFRPIMLDTKTKVMEHELYEFNLMNKGDTLLFIDETEEDEDAFVNTVDGILEGVVSCGLADSDHQFYYKIDLNEDNKIILSELHAANIDINIAFKGDQIC